MNTIKMIKYSFLNSIRGTGIYFGVILIMLHLFSLISMQGEGGGVGGMDCGLIVFMMILGIATFRETFHLSLQSGVSRKSMITGMAISNILIAISAAAGELIVDIIGNFYEKKISGFTYNSIYEQIFFGYHNDGMNASDYLASFLTGVSVYIGIIFTGLFIGILFYRLSKVMKFVIPIGIYVLVQLFFIIDMVCFQGKAMTKLVEFMQWVFGESSHLAESFLVLGAVFLVISFIASRRLAINDKAA